LFEAATESLISYNFLMTLARAAPSMVLATETKAAIGLAFPKLANSANIAAFCFGSGGIFYNLGIIISKASITFLCSTTLLECNF
jgi:hypothetical protein